jgi:hypothetical protein
VGDDHHGAVDFFDSLTDHLGVIVQAETEIAAIGDAE